MPERLGSFSSGVRTGLGLAALVGVGVAIGNKLRRSGTPSTEPEPTVPGIPFTHTQLERGSTALAPFVDEWKLGLNPENLDLMTYAVLKHASNPGDLASESDFEQIDADVRGMIGEDRASHQRMLEAQQRDIDSRG